MRAPQSFVNRRPAAGGAAEGRARRLVAAAALAFVVLAMPRPAHAWGAAGHRIVCEIAWDELTSRVKSHLKEILATDPKNPQFNEVCNWPDRVRDEPAFADDKIRHYVDSSVPGTGIDLARDCPQRCVVEGIERYARIVIDGGTPERSQLQALAFVAHFVADIHQPLHVGYTRDAGGNKIHIRPAPGAKLIDLHEFWDANLVDAIPGSWRDVAARLEGRISDEDRAFTGTQLDPLAWAQETHRLAIRWAYELPPDDIATKAYTDARVRVVEEQLTRAGLRLGSLMNQLLETDATAALFMTGVAARPHNPLMGDDAPVGAKPGQ